ncbi:MAG: ATP-binding protein [Geobacter sp.]|jgi:serine/threonine-protein kinase RsbW|nr:ATP-binding protein [Geobacter sp.]
MKKNQIELEIRVPNQTRYLSLIGKISEELIAQVEGYVGDRETLANHLNVVLTEALVNAIRHANENNPEEVVQIRITISDNEILMQVFDHGRGFNLTRAALNPNDNRHSLDEHGRGLFIMQSLMDSVEYRPTKDGNVLEMRKRYR